jgi:hypothetical protein
MWCPDCRTHIIDGELLKASDRTFEAQNGVICPFTSADNQASIAEPVEDIA